MIFKWLNTRKASDLAKSVIDDLVKRYPPEGKDVLVEKAAERLRKTHDSLFARIEAFARTSDLNTYKIAHLGNRIRWGLKEAGYPKEFAETFTKEVVTIVTVNSRARENRKAGGR